MLSRLADLAHARSRLVIVAAIAAAVAAGVFGGPVAGLLSASGSNFEDTDSESVRARALLEEAAGASPEAAIVALVETGADVRTSQAARDKVEAVAREIASDPVVARAVTFYDTRDPSFVSNDGTATIVVGSFKPVPEAETEEAIPGLIEAFEGDPAVTLGGGEVVGEELGEQVGKDLARAEAIAFPLLFLLSLFIFRGVVAALLPLIAGAFAILGTFLVLRIANEVTPLSIFALNLVTGLGLGLAIDYSLFIVSRYREELARVGPGREALRRTLATAGRTVAYSSLTVAAALAALLVFPQPFLYSMGIGGIAVALISAVVALVVLPAILAALGTRVNSLAPARWRRAAERTAEGRTSGFWYRLSRAVMRRPIPVATASAALLIALGLPFLNIEFTGVDANVLPKNASARQVSDALATRFPADRTSPVYLAVEAPRSEGAEVQSYAAGLRELPGVAEVLPPQPVGDALWRVDVLSANPALDNRSKELVREIRDRETPFEVKVGGETAAFVDQQSSLGDTLPLGIAILAFGTFVLLFLMTGSVILPLKAILMNLLTLSAALGILVLVFQDGRLEGLLDYESVGALDSTQPILLFAVAFALSTDYAVFLLTRIKEARDAGMDNTEAVATGLERTGRIVTAAALLFSIAIGAFSTSEIAFIKEVGVGTALAVLIDASLVRALLVPSLMKLLGGWNWWAPGPLRRLHERFGFSEAEEAPASS
ncbi:MAG: MMPL family transporter [Gaiellaceae bacterium]